jgi:RNA polymerase sigma factor (sigma-70 family)
MDETDWLAERFEAFRPHLQAVAYRMLGSLSEADDAVQESWLRVNRADTSGVENLRGWLTTVVARVCLDALRSRASRHEEPFSAHEPEETVSSDRRTDPENETLLADSVGLAMLVVLETLNPAERVLFVLHDMFAVPFDEIARIVGRSSAAARQLASRARRRVQGTSTVRDANRTRHREVVDAFLAASRGGDFDALLALLDPDVVFRADRGRENGRIGGAPGRSGCGRNVFWAGPGCTTGAREWYPRSCVGTGRAAPRRLRVHHHARTDRPDRRTRRSRTSPPA